MNIFFSVHCVLRSTSQLDYTEETFGLFYTYSCMLLVMIDGNVKYPGHHPCMLTKPKVYSRMRITQRLQREKER